MSRARGRKWKIREKYRNQNYLELAELYFANEKAYKYYDYQVRMVNRYHRKWDNPFFSTLYYDGQFYSRVFLPPSIWIRKYKSNKKALKIARDHYYAEMKLLEYILEGHSYDGQYGDECIEFNKDIFLMEI